MTWNELGEFIEKLDAAQRAGAVKFVEPYDKEPAGHFVTASFAREDLTVVGDGGQQELFVRRAEPFLE